MKTIGCLLVIAMGALVSSPAHGALADWSFDGATTGSNPYSADTGSLNGLSSATLGMSPAGRNSITVNTPATGAASPASAGYLEIAGTARHVANSTLTFTLNTSARVTPSLLSFDYRAGGHGASSVNWSYTIAGATTGAGHLGSESLTQSGAWIANGGYSISGIGTVDAGSTITLVGTLQGGTANDAHSGNISFDDFSFATISPVPEPITCALPLFGLAFIGGTAGRFYLRRRQQVRLAESKA